MPTTVKVKVSEVGSTTRGNYNMVVIKGYDATNNKGFKKDFFETTKSGGLTKNAEVAQGLVAGDWVDVTVDDSSYKNVQKITKTSAPAGGGGGAPSGSSAGRGRMSKAEWAAKDAAKDQSIARSVALKSAVDTIVPSIASGKSTVKAGVTAIEKLVDRFEKYLLHGDFDYVKPEPASDDDGGDSDDDSGDAPAPPDEDDDIPF
jgi:hypothetical protein